MPPTPPDAPVTAGGEGVEHVAGELFQLVLGMGKSGVVHVVFFVASPKTVIIAAVYCFH